MTSMSYCRHENTLADLEQVWDMWEEGADNEYEKRARKRLIALIKEMADYIDEDEDDDDL